VIDFKGSHFEREIVLWGVRGIVTVTGSGSEIAHGQQ
jgi:hypothetical protein